MKKQVICLNGGAPKENFHDFYDFLEKSEYSPYKEIFLNWNKTLGTYLGDDFEYIRIPFPSADFADYTAWKIMFEKIFPYLQDDCILITNSLGGTFLLKYMIETGFPNRFGKRIEKLFFLAPALHDSIEEKLGSFTFDTSKIAQIVDISAKIYIYHSSDDTIVPIGDSEELFSYFPKATFRKFSDKGHFFQLERLPEIEEDILAP